MATDAANDITHVLTLAVAHTEYLGAIRHWDNLRIATDGNTVFVKDFTPAQLDSVEVKSIPYKNLYSVRDHKLFPQGSLLPSQRMPSSLLWSPIDRALPVTLPGLNHHFFGVNQTVSVSLVPATQEKEAAAMLVPMDVLGQALSTLPAVRLQKLEWAILDAHTALVLGTPLLPISGNVLWGAGDFLVPAGLEFDLPALCPTLNHILNPERAFWVVWDAQTRYFLLDKKRLKPLSLGSFRLSRNEPFLAVESQPAH